MSEWPTTLMLKFLHNEEAEGPIEHMQDPIV